MKIFPKSIVCISFLAILNATSCTEDSNEVEAPGTDVRDKYTGVWSCKETIGSSVFTFDITIYKVGNGDSIAIQNFSGLNNNTYAGAHVSGNTFSIPAQQIGVTNVPVQGSGSYIEPEKLKMNYTTDGNTASAECTR